MSASVRGRSGQVANALHQLAQGTPQLQFTQFNNSSVLQNQNSSALQLFIAQQCINYKQHESQVRAQLRRDATLNVPPAGKTFAHHNNNMRQHHSPKPKNSS